MDEIKSPSGRHLASEQASQTASRVRIRRKDSVTVALLSARASTEKAACSGSSSCHGAASRTNSYTCACVKVRASQQLEKQANAGSSHAPTQGGSEAKQGMQHVVEW